MITVAFYKRRHIRRGMFTEKEVVILIALRMLPHIESLVDHQHSQAVTGIEKLPGRRVVTGADGIEAILFQKTHFTFLRPVIGSRSQQPVVMMQASAFQLDGTTIQQKSPAYREVKRPDAECGPVVIGCFAGGNHPDMRFVKCRPVDRPDFRLPYVGRKPERMRTARDHFAGIFFCRDGRTVRTNQSEQHRYTGFLIHPITDGKCDLHLCPFSSDDRSLHLYLLIRDEKVTGDGQTNVAVDARSLIPTAVVTGIERTDHHHILLSDGIQKRGQVIAERHISIRVETEMVPVDPDIRPLHNPVEANTDLLP